MNAFILELPDLMNGDGFHNKTGENQTRGELPKRLTAMLPTKMANVGCYHAQFPIQFLLS
jgi:hypothetical protein